MTFQLEGTSMSDPVTLSSRALGGLVRGIFWTVAIYTLILVVMSAILVATGQNSGGMHTTTVLMLGFLGLGYLPMLILAIIWVVMFHRDLKAVYPDYPMSPVKAVLFMFIPFFNLYGLWRTFATISEYLRASGGEAGQLGDRANFWSTLGYLSIWVGNIVYFFVQGGKSGLSTAQTVTGMDLLVTTFCMSAFVLCYLNSIRYSQRSLSLQAAKGMALDTRAVLTHMR
jgi:hypothetical protein